MTEFTAVQQHFANNLPHISFAFAEPMSRHTSFRIGGNAEVMAFPKNGDELRALMHTARQIGCPMAVIGAGTNILAPDAGMPGLVICLKEGMDGMERLPGDRIRVSAGVTMTRAAIFAANHGLSGMEFAHGIPGTVGGGVYMNAGAYGGEICQICESVEVMDLQGNITTYTGDEMGFAYRHSRLEEEGSIVLSAVFRLTPADLGQIRDTMHQLQAKRSASQPLDKPSAGSAFKRPVGGYAAALIDQAGLKGYRVGDAAISEKHAGFAVNLGNASAEDVQRLLQQVSDIVYEKFGIRLEPEVRIW